MKPYYQDDAVTIYHGDCAQISPLLDPGMIVITDQPYGTGWVRGGGKVGEFKASHEKPDWDVWSPLWVSSLNRPRVIAGFCPVGRAEEFAHTLEFPALLYYQKTNVRPNGVDREVIVVSPPPRQNKPWRKVAYNGDMPLHPCQKPIEVMLWLVDLLSTQYDTILDPFTGSGTTLRAAKDLGRKAIGIELEERYCEIAAKRMQQEVLQLTTTKAPLLVVKG